METITFSALKFLEREKLRIIAIDSHSLLKQTKSKRLKHYLQIRNRCVLRS